MLTDLQGRSRWVELFPQAVEAISKVNGHLFMALEGKSKSQVQKIEKNFVCHSGELYKP